MSAMLTAEEALKLVGEIFVYHMPFNRALGLELERYEKDFAQLSFNNQPMMVGNWAQSILHGGVIATKTSCVSAYPAWVPSIYASIICVPGAETASPAAAACSVRVIRSPWRVLNCITKNNFISPAQPPLIWWVEAEKSGKVNSLFCHGFSRWMLNRRGRACYSPLPLILFGVSHPPTLNLSLTYRLMRSSLTASSGPSSS